MWGRSEPRHRCKNVPFRFHVPAAAETMFSSPVDEFPEPSFMTCSWTTWTQITVLCPPSEPNCSNRQLTPLCCWEVPNSAPHSLQQRVEEVVQSVCGCASSFCQTSVNTRDYYHAREECVDPPGRHGNSEIWNHIDNNSSSRRLIFTSCWVFNLIFIHSSDKLVFFVETRENKKSKYKKKLLLLLMINFISITEKVTTGVWHMNK